MRRYSCVPEVLTGQEKLKFDQLLLVADRESDHRFNERTMAYNVEETLREALMQDAEGSEGSFIKSDLVKAMAGVSTEQDVDKFLADLGYDSSAMVFEIGEMSDRFTDVLSSLGSDVGSMRSTAASQEMLSSPPSLC